MDTGRKHAIAPGNVLAGVLVILGSARLFTRGVELFRLAMTEFFLPQFETRFFPGSRPVVTIDHPFDVRIPFVQGQVRTYLGFIGVWMAGLGALSRRFGTAALRDIAESIRALCRLYRAAGSVYKRCQSTTKRPLGPPLSPRFMVIRLFDPHLHCVPSLHVLIVCYNYLNLQRLLGRRTGDGNDALATEAYQAALEVIRAMLLVKQHSLADIGQSLFMLSELFPEYDSLEAKRFAGDLFRGFPGVPSALRTALRQAVLADYRDLELERRKHPGVRVEDLVAGYLETWRPRPRQLRTRPARRPSRPGRPTPQAT